MKYLLDTGPLVALLDEKEAPKLRQGARKAVFVVEWAMYTCEAVLTEAAHFLRTVEPLVEMVEAGELRLLTRPPTRRPPPDCVKGTDEARYRTLIERLGIRR